jgi:hypothetical protein
MEGGGPAYYYPATDDCTKFGQMALVIFLVTVQISVSRICDLGVFLSRGEGKYIAYAAPHMSY